VRKLDYPSSASIDEIRHLMQSGGNARPVSMPLLVYRIFPDGREELVRGLRFRGLSTRSLKDIVAASDESYVFDFIDSNAILALMGAGSFTTSASVIAPSLLFDELELEPVQEETPKPPIVPPPPLGGASTIGKHAAGARRQQTSTGAASRLSAAGLLHPAACPPAACPPAA
jgi:hypothetical protein